MSRSLKLLAALVALALAYLLDQAGYAALHAGWLALASVTTLLAAMTVTAAVLLAVSMFLRGGAR